MFVSSPAGCPAEGSIQECMNPFKAFQGCMRLLTVDDKPLDLITVQQRLMGNYSHLQIDMCGIIDRFVFIQRRLTGTNVPHAKFIFTFVHPGEEVCLARQQDAKRIQ